MHKNFTFKGTVTSNDNILATDGECIELLNLRMVNGSLRPIPENVEVERLSALYSSVYWHDSASCYLCIKSEAPYELDIYDKNWILLCNSHGDVLKFPSLVGVTALEIIGNVVCCMTSRGLFYLLYAGGTYRFLGDRPIVPKLSVGYTSKIHKVTTDTTFTRDKVDTDISSTWVYNSRGYIDECVSKCNKAGYYIDRALFRFALRMFDGSYIYTSHVIYVSDDNILDGLQRDSGNMLSESVSSDAESLYTVSVMGFKPQFTFSSLRLEDWEGVILGIDVFTTGSIIGKKIDSVTTTLYSSETHKRVKEKYEAYVDKTLDELYNEVSDASMYYKVAEFDIYGNCMHEADDVSLSSLVLLESLGSFDTQPLFSSVIPGCSYVFNNRLHIASLREYFFKGYDEHSVSPAGDSHKIAESVVLQTRIKTQNGIVTVLNEFKDVELGYRNGKFEFPALISYPDSRAFEMSLFIYDDTELFMKRLVLTPHKYLNIAQYIHKWSLPYTVTIESQFENSFTLPRVSDADVVAVFNGVAGTHEVIFSSAMNSWTYKGMLFPPSEYSGLRIFAIPRNVTDGDKIVFVIKENAATTDYCDIRNIPYDSSWKLMSGYTDYGEENVYEDRPNIMKVSKNENPFLFLAKNTYTMSKGNVIAMCTNTMTMSEGQFGQHPLYVFSRSGIDVLSVDASGATAYSSIHPVSNEVCQNGKSVCGIDAGVVFHGSQGIMLASGNKLLKLSTAVDYDTKELETVKRTSVFNDIAGLHSAASIVSATPFNKYIKGALILRNPLTDEIMVCNHNYSYSYIYSLSSAVWSKVAGSFSGAVKYAESFTLLKRDGTSTSVQQPGDIFTGSNNVLLITRPLLFGTKLPKRIMQLMLHGYLSKPEEYSGPAPFFSCFLLCSNDGVHFKIVAGCEKSSESQDVAFPYFPTCSYRYYIFAFSAALKSTSMITGLELDVSLAWNNRLR